MLAASSHDRNNHSECDYIAIAIHVHTALLHADIDKEWFGEPPSESELSEIEAWKLPKRWLDVAQHRNCGIDRSDLFLE